MFNSQGSLLSSLQKQAHENRAMTASDVKSYQETFHPSLHSGLMGDTFWTKERKSCGSFGWESKQWTEKSLNLCVEFVHVRGIIPLDGQICRINQNLKDQRAYILICVAH